MVEVAVLALLAVLVLLVVLLLVVVADLVATMVADFATILADLVPLDPVPLDLVAVRLVRLVRHQAAVVALDPLCL